MKTFESEYEALFLCIETDFAPDMCAHAFSDGALVVFAGEMSWGDTPCGVGYDIIKSFHLINRATNGELGKFVGAE